MSNYEGGCACGSVRYKCTAEPSFSFHCQCRQCQRITGSGHSSQFALDAESIEVSGQLKYFKMNADSGNEVSSGFCQHCGSPVLKRTSGFPDTCFVHAGSLDEPGRFKPTAVVWEEGSQEWDYIDPKLKDTAN